MEATSTRRSNRFFILKIDLPALLAFAFFAGLIFFYLIPGFEKAMMEGKRVMIKEMTSSAYSLLEYYHALEKEGRLTAYEAKEQARSAISAIRYGETRKDYFWITDMHPRMIMHPYRSELNGHDLSDFRDPGGKTLFVDFVKAVSDAGESYVDYLWQWNDDSTRVVPKLSFVRMFKPWGWIIGTGIYIEDVRSEIRSMEFRALIISGIIAFLIVLMLAAISRQSHAIEEKRNRAEEELRKSRELYRALAEAASEGVLIWSAQGLQANKILLSWLDYTEEELNTTRFQHIFSSLEIPEHIDSEALYDELSTNRYAECTLKMKNGNLIKSHADFSRILLGGLKAVMLVIHPVKSLLAQSDFSPRTPLMDAIGTGFFRTTFGRKHRFIHATAPALELLGYNNLQELLPHTLESFFIHPFQLKAFRSTMLSRETMLRKEVLLRRKSGDAFRALLSVLVIENSPQEIWCEGTIEYLGACASGKNLPWVDLKTYGASYILEAPVASVMNTPAECPENFPVARAVSIMKEIRSDILVVRNKAGNPLGIIDAATIGFRLSEGGSNETEVFRWMSSPPEVIRFDASISEALGRLKHSHRKYLLVNSDENKITGVISSAELISAFSDLPELLTSDIANAYSANALRNIYQNSRKTTISMILGQADPSAISMHISEVADAFCQRILTLCLEEAGEPPCRFAFIQTGSAGRMEQTLSTDQDNAIIFENLKGEELQSAYAYFTLIGKRVNEMLSFTGYQLCPGQNMAGNPAWCQPLDSWKKYFSDWIVMPGPEELLEVSIFFDFRFCFGDSSLTDELREFVKSDLAANDIFFHHMAAAWKPFNPSAANLSQGKTDIKRILMPLTGLIRLYALKYSLNGYSTLERSVELYSGGKLDHQLLREIIRAWKDLSSLRLSHQASCINKGIEPDNIIDFRGIGNDLLSYAEQAIATVNNLMLKTGNDFYTESL